jgi:hypothetical protein
MKIKLDKHHFLWYNGVIRMKDFIHKHPRLTYLSVGLIMGLIMSGFTVIQTDKTVKILEETVIRNKSELKEYSESATKTITALRSENKKLKSKKSTYKIIKPDGTVEERTSSETESEESVSESVREEYEKKVFERIKKSEEEFMKKLETVTKENKKLTISGGITTGLKYYGAGSYKVWSPLTIEASAFSDGSFAFGIGLSL